VPGHKEGIIFIFFKRRQRERKREYNKKKNSYPFKIQKEKLC